MSSPTPPLTLFLQQLENFASTLDLTNVNNASNTISSFIETQLLTPASNSLNQINFLSNAFERLSNQFQNLTSQQQDTLQQNINNQINQWLDANPQIKDNINKFVTNQTLSLFKQVNPVTSTLMMHYSIIGKLLSK
jgi:hypothetical protein